MFLRIFSFLVSDPGDDVKELDELLAKMKNGKLEDYDNERLAKLLGIDEKDLERQKAGTMSSSKARAHH
jgi:hypothetical protein